MKGHLSSVCGLSLHCPTQGHGVKKDTGPHRGSPAGRPGKKKLDSSTKYEVKCPKSLHNQTFLEKNLTFFSSFLSECK